MNQLARCIATATLGMFLIAVTGCNPTEEPAKPESREVAPPAETDRAGNEPESTDSDGPSDSGSPVEPVIEQESGVPEVYLSEQHANASKVKVGDTVPRLEFEMVDGKQPTLQELQQLAGIEDNGLTILAFWKPGDGYSEMQTNDLQLEFAPQMKSKPLAIVSVAAGGTAADAQAMAEATGASFPIVFDPGEESLGKLATSEFLPRVYLLDAAGLVIWFDIEHSRDTRRNLQQAIEVTLAEPKAE